MATTFGSQQNLRGIKLLYTTKKNVEIFKAKKLLGVKRIILEEPILSDCTEIIDLRKAGVKNITREKLDHLHLTRIVLDLE